VRLLPAPNMYQAILGVELYSSYRLCLSLCECFQLLSRKPRLVILACLRSSSYCCCSSSYCCCCCCCCRYAKRRSNVVWLHCVYRTLAGDFIPVIAAVTERPVKAGVWV
jgi:hypothetical protein